MKIALILMAATLIYILLLLLLPIVAATAIRRFFAVPLKRGHGFRYEAVPLLTPAEQSFFRVLQQTTGGSYTPFPKVRLADIIHPAKSASRSGWQSAFNRIACKHVDFAICDAQTLRLLAVIELDDKTHGRFERGNRDALVDAALADAGIPILRVRAAHAYSVAQIRQEIENLIRSPVNASDQDLIKA